MPAELTAAASAIVAQGAAYPTLAGSCRDGNAGAMTSDGSMSSIGSDSCGRPHSDAADAACTSTGSRPSVVGVDDARPGAHTSRSAAAAAAAGWTATAYASPLACKSGPRQHLGASSSGGWGSGSGSSSGSGGRSKKSREGGLLVVRPAEPYVRPPPQPLLRPDASTVTTSYNGVGVSPNTSLYTSITTLDDPFGNAKRRRATSLMTAATSRGTCTLQPSAYETTHPRGRLSVADTRHLLGTSSDEDDEAEDEWDSSSHHHGPTSSST